MAKKQEETRAKDPDAVVAEDRETDPKPLEKSSESQGIVPDLQKKLRAADARIKQLEDEASRQSLELLSALSQPDCDCAYVGGQWRDVEYQGTLKDASYQGHLRNLDETALTLVLKKAK